MDLKILIMYRNTLTLLLIIAFSLSFSFCQENNYNKIRLFYLGGQSNMDGYGYNRDLPDSLNQTYKNVWIFHGNTAGDQQPNGGLGKWEVLKPGHGVGFFSDGIKNNLSNRFGIELSFIKKLQAIYPNEKIALIKYSKGGTSIDGQAAGNYGSWDPDFKDGTGINQYDHFLNTIKSNSSHVLLFLH